MKKKELKNKITNHEILNKKKKTSKKIILKNKLTNHATLNGEKKTSEKIILKSFKELQKNSKKQSKKIWQLAIIRSTPLFKLHKTSYKKRKKRTRTKREIPVFISKSTSRTSSAIKFILQNSKKKNSNKFFFNFKKEIISSTQFIGSTVEFKNNLQKYILLKKKRITRHYYKDFKFRNKLKKSHFIKKINKKL